MKTYRLFLITVKQYLCSPFLLLLLIAAPCLCLLAANRQKADTDDHIRVGYCILAEDGSVEDEPDEDIQWLIENLNEGGSLFYFYRSSDPDVLRTEVARGQTECGYLIPSDLFVQLRERSRKNLVPLLTSPRTTMSEIINETLYATIFQRLSGQMLLQYLKEDSAASDAWPELFTDDSVDELYQKYLTNGSTFSFTYDNTVKEFHYGTHTVLTSPLRGLFAVLILLSGFAGALSYYQAAEHPVFARPEVRIVRILVPMLFALLISLTCLFLIPGVPGISRTLSGFFSEAGRLLLYTLLCLVFLLLCTTLIPSKGVLYAFFPLYLMGCLIFSPIFVDAGQYLPLLKTVSRFFLPTWYLL